MLINTEIIRKLNPCDSRFDNYLTHYQSFEGILQDFITLENITYDDKVWVVTRLFTKEQNVKWALLCASKVLSIFEDKYPDDKRPRKALEAAEAWLNNPSEENRQAANAAADAASAAYAVARAVDAASAAARAASAAAYAARAASDVCAVASAAARAASAVCAAYATSDVCAAYDVGIEGEVNLLLMLECI